MDNIQCVVLKCESEAMIKAPYPGELGERILANVSQEGWKKWLSSLTVIINENGLNTANPNHLKVIEDYMLGFLFSEGQYAQTVQTGMTH